MPTMRRGIAAIALALAVPGLALAGAGRAAGDDRSRLDFWKSNYTELRREEDPRAAKAHEIFARVLRAAGRRAGVAPSLYVIKDAGTAVPLAIALPDGGIVISRRVLDICYGEPELGDDRLAFLLAHEIAHQLKDDFWHLRFFAAVELSRQDKPEDAAVEEVRRIAGLAKEALLKEMQADEYGIVYASMAGFDTRAVVTEDGRVNFFKYFASALDPGNLKGPPRDPEHPTPEARAEAVKARLAQVLDVVELFDLGLLFYQTGDFEAASRLFAEFLRYYPSREVHHNLATSHHQLALKWYLEWKGPYGGFPFMLSLTVESETRARGMHFRGAPESAEEARFREEIEKAVEHYRTALDQDPSFWPSSNNLGCALLLLESPYEAIGSLQKALHENPRSPLILGNLGAAFFAAENPAKAKGTLLEALEISATHGPVLYNLGLIASLEKDLASAKKYWEALLQADPGGLWASRIVIRMPIEVSPEAPPAKAASGRESLGGLSVGHYTDEIPKDWGAPVKSRSFPGGDEPIVMLAFEGGALVAARDDEIVLITASPSPPGPTAEGIRPGAGTADLLAKYGRPSGIGLSSTGEAWAYAGRGIAFVVRGGKVVSWILFRPS
jgi:tetratricopeptide (TPR) repeat protein